MHGAEEGLSGLGMIRVLKGYGGAFAPEEIGGQAESEEDDGYGQVAELGGVVEGEVDGIGDYGRGGYDED
jgi:hypothetical protein